jgi:hypothetical protein
MRKLGKLDEALLYVEWMHLLGDSCPARLLTVMGDQG